MKNGFPAPNKELSAKPKTTGEQVEGRTTHQVKELLFGTPYGG
jgi:hypothetical protein